MLLSLDVNFCPSVQVLPLSWLWRFAQKSFDQALERCGTDKSWQTATVTCGHDVMIDQPEELAAMLERFA